MRKDILLGVSMCFFVLAGCTAIGGALGYEYDEEGYVTDYKPEDSTAGKLAGTADLFIPGASAVFGVISGLFGLFQRKKAKSKESERAKMELAAKSLVSVVQYAIDKKEKGEEYTAKDIKDVAIKLKEEAGVQEEIKKILGK